MSNSATNVNSCFSAGETIKHDFKRLRYFHSCASLSSFWGHQSVNIKQQSEKSLCKCSYHPDDSYVSPMTSQLQDKSAAKIWFKENTYPSVVCHFIPFIGDRQSKQILLYINNFTQVLCETDQQLYRLILRHIFPSLQHFWNYDWLIFKHVTLTFFLGSQTKRIHTHTHALKMQPPK